MLELLIIDFKNKFKKETFFNNDIFNISFIVCSLIFILYSCNSNKNKNLEFINSNQFLEDNHLISRIDTGLIGHWKISDIYNNNESFKWDSGQIDLHFHADETFSFYARFCSKINLNQSKKFDIISHEKQINIKDQFKFKNINGSYKFISKNKIIFFSNFINNTTYNGQGAFPMILNYTIKNNKLKFSFNEGYNDFKFIFGYYFGKQIFGFYYYLPYAIQRRNKTIVSDKKNPYYIEIDNLTKQY